MVTRKGVGGDFLTHFTRTTTVWGGNQASQVAALRRSH